MLAVTFSAAYLYTESPFECLWCRGNGLHTDNSSKNVEDVSVQTTPYQGKRKAKKASFMIKDNIPLGITLSVSPNTCRVGQVIGAL